MIKDSAIPLYYQLKASLLEQIEAGTLKPGDQIPPEFELCKRYDLSRGTVRHALKELIVEGRLYRVRGRGTFVAQPREQWSFATTISIGEALDQQGIPYSTHLLEQQPSKAEGVIASNLRVEPGEPIIYLKRFRRVDGKPYALFYSYVLARLVPGLLETDTTARSFYKLLEETFGVRVASMDRVILARPATDEEARLLEIPGNSAVLVSDEIVYDAEGRAVEYSQSVFRGDTGRVRLRVTRR